MADRVLPMVRLFFPCEDAALDIESAAWILTEPLHTVWIPRESLGRFSVNDLWLCAQLTDGVGEFNLSVEMRNEAGIRVGRSKPSRQAFPGGEQLAVLEVVFHLKDVPIHQPGIHEFRVVANHADDLHGGVVSLRVLQE